MIFSTNSSNSHNLDKFHTFSAKMVIIKLPICKGSYSNEVDYEDVDFLLDFNYNIGVQYGFGAQVPIGGYARKYHPFFAGMCYNSFFRGTLKKPLSRCGGCQLVAYCSKECQRDNWAVHKYVCKEFPVVHGKNVLQSTGPWKDHIAGLRERAAQLPNPQAQAALSIFRNPRVCNTCRVARSDRLKDCKCALVSYCSKRCIKSDKQHKADCPVLRSIGEFFSFGGDNRPDVLPHLKYFTICKKFEPVYCWDDIIPFEYKARLHILIHVEQKETAELDNILVNERLSYSMSLLFALQTLPGRRLGCENLPLEDLTTLEVHVITSIPLIDSEYWEIFMHRLPKLKELNIVLIMPGKAYRQSFGLISMSLLRCPDCAENNRIITYSVHQMLYHLYFSLPEYTEPDVVVVYGNKHEMSSSEDDAIHSEISYRNMTSSPHTVLVMTDATPELLVEGIRNVNAARRIDQLVPLQENLLKGYSSNRTELDFEPALINEKKYFTCLRRK